MHAQVQESGGAEVRKGVHISPTEEVELSGSRGTANFAMKFDKVRVRVCGRCDGDAMAGGAMAGGRRAVDARSRHPGANDCVRLQGSKKEASVNVQQIKGVTRSYTQEDAEAQAFVPIAAFECRGLEPIAYSPQVRLPPGRWQSFGPLGERRCSSRGPSGWGQRESTLSGRPPLVKRVQGGWVVTAANSSTRWEDVSLDDEWVEYDEKAGESVSILKVESQIKLHTG